MNATTIRPEVASDIVAIHAVEAAAFGRDDEADLVDALRRAGEDFMSLVAGSMLVEEGVRNCRARATDAVFVLGHPKFYTRFGFQPASRFGVSCEFTVPDEVFLLMEFVPGTFDGQQGMLRYPKAFHSERPNREPTVNANRT